MWLLKTKGFDKENIYSSKTIKHKIIMRYYPLNCYLENKTYYFTAVGIVEGDPSNISAFFEDLRKDSKKSKNKRYVVRLEVNGNFFVCTTAQNKNAESENYVHFFYDQKFIHITPAVIDSNGYEEWNIAAIDRKDIEKGIKIGLKKYNAEILSFKKTKLKNFGVLSVLPELTDKQRQAFLLASARGYYEYPRKIGLEGLAKLMKISLSTYQAHLRKAEKHLLGFIAKRYF